MIRDSTSDALLEPYVPEDFDRFWAQVVAESEHVPLKFNRTRQSEIQLPGFSIDWLDFRGMDVDLHGWIAIPTTFTIPLPAFLWLPAYGRESHLPDEFSTRQGMVSFSFNVHGHEAFHQETYTPSRGYFADGVESPETWVFRKIIQHCLIAVRVLQAQLEVDETRLAAAGLSQGGGLALWTGVHSKRIQTVVADFPFLSAMRWVLSKEVYRYPLKELIDFSQTIPLGMERILHTLSYFDTLNQATRMEKPTLVSLGLRDPSVRPQAVRAVYDAVRGQKRLVEYPGGHDWDVAMISTNRTWLLEQLK